MSIQIHKVCTDDLWGIYVSGNIKLHVKNIEGIHVFRESLERELWIKDGLIDRDDGPAFIYTDYSENGETFNDVKKWYSKGKLNRNKDPAVISVIRTKLPNETKNVYNYHKIEELWFEMDVLHRDPLDGPAIIKYCIKSGQKDTSRYYIHGRRLYDRDLISYITTIIEDPEASSSKKSLAQSLRHKISHHIT